jgi:hypothetical protein
MSYDKACFRQLFWSVNFQIRQVPYFTATCCFSSLNKIRTVLIFGWGLSGDVPIDAGGFIDRQLIELDFMVRFFLLIWKAFLRYWGALKILESICPL